MLTVAGVVAGGKIERVGLSLGPEAVELGGVPHNLVHQLRDSDGMSGGTVASKTQEGSWAADGVGDVVLVVGTVEILAIPACREVNVGSNTTGAWSRRESLGIDSKSDGQVKHSGQVMIWFCWGVDSLVVLAWSRCVATEVWSGVASIAVLPFQGSPCP
jgi:hypothetical protein